LAITLPITADTIYTLIVRLSRKENIFEAYRSHIFQRLQQSGWSHSKVALTYLVLTIKIAVLIFILGTVIDYRFSPPESPMLGDFETDK